MSYQAKDTVLYERQLVAQTVVYTGNLSTGVGNSNFNTSVVVNNAVIGSTTVTLDVGELVKFCYRVTVRNRVTGAQVLVAGVPYMGDTNKITVILDATGLTDVVIEFVFSTTDHALAVAAALSPSSVSLLTAINYAILSKAGITNTTGSLVTGDIATSPDNAASITNFGLALDVGGAFSTSASVTGRVFAADYAAPTPGLLTQAVSDMEAAYTDAAGRPNPDSLNRGAGIIGGLVFQPGVHKFTTNVTIPTNVTLNGGASDVFIFQIAGTLDLSAGISVLLTGGASAKNVFFAVAGATTLHANSVFNGNILSKTSIAIQTTAVFNGRALAQTAVTLDNVAVTPVL